MEANLWLNGRLDLVATHQFALLDPMVELRSFKGFVAKGGRVNYNIIQAQAH